MSTIKDIKVEGQSFDIGFITVHKDADSFVAQCEKQNLWPKMDPAKRETMIRELYAFVVGQPQQEPTEEVEPVAKLNIPNSGLKAELARRSIDTKGVTGFDKLRGMLDEHHARYFEHKVDEQTLTDNPEMVEQGIKIGDTIWVPRNPEDKGE